MAAGGKIERDKESLLEFLFESEETSSKCEAASREKPATMWWHDETCVSDKNCSCSHPSDAGIAWSLEFAEILKINNFLNGQFKNILNFQLKIVKLIFLILFFKVDAKSYLIVKKLQV